MSKIMNTRSITAILLVTTLAGCGGGGGSPTPTPPPPPPPPATYALSATVTGLDGALVLQNNGGSNVSVTANGIVPFGTGISAGTPYDITVVTQPANPAQECSVASGSGVLNSNVAVAITCANIPLALTFSTPANNSIGVELDAIPSMSFSRTLDAATVTSATVTLASIAGSEEISPTVAGNALNVGHALGLRPLTHYTLTASTALRGSASEALAGAASAAFTTKDASWRFALAAESGNNVFARNSRAAVDPQDRRLVVWEQHDGTRYRLRARVALGGLFQQPAFYLDGGATTSVSDSTLAMNAAGDIIVAWIQNDGVRESVRGIRRNATNTWLGLQYLEQSDLGDAEEPQAVIDADSRGLVVFAVSDGTRRNLHARHFGATSFGQLQLVESDSAGDAIDPRVALGPDGIAHIIWSQHDGTQTNIWENTVPLGGAMGSRVPVENAVGNATLPQIAVDPAGNVIAVWKQMANGVGNMYANRRSANGNWGTPVLIETSAGTVSPPSLAIDHNGNALVAWAQPTTARLNMWANRYDVVSGWGTATLLETDDAGDAFTPRVAFDPSGNGMVVWTQSDGTDNNLFAVRAPSSGGFSNALDIYSGFDNSPVMQSLMFDSRGTGLATYIVGGSTDNIVALKTFE
jgi:hypothetical protein